MGVLVFVFKIVGMSVNVMVWMAVLLVSMLMCVFMLVFMFVGVAMLMLVFAVAHVSSPNGCVERCLNLYQDIHCPEFIKR